MALPRAACPGEGQPGMESWAQAGRVGTGVGRLVTADRVGRSRHSQAPAVQSQPGGDKEEGSRAGLGWRLQQGLRARAPG